MSKFKVGDKVRVVRSSSPRLPISSVHTVVKVRGEDSDMLFLDSAPAVFWFASRFVLVSSGGPGLRAADLKVGDRLVVARGETAYLRKGDRLVVRSVHGHSVRADNETTGALHISLSDGDYLDLVAKVDQPKPQSKRPIVEKRILTNITIPCASDDGAGLFVEYDPKGNVAGDGPCIDFTLDEVNYVDIEDISTLDTLIRFLNHRRDDFRADAQKANA